MKRVLQSIEFVLLLCMGVLVAEMQSHFIQKTLHNLLKKEGISFGLHLHSLTHITFQDIHYHHKLLAKELDIRYRLLPLLDLVLYFDSISAKGVNLNAIESLATSKKGSKKSSGNLPLRPFIARLSLEAFYRYKSKNTLALLAKDIDLRNAKIEKLTLHTFAGTLLAKGEIKNQIAYLKGSLRPTLALAKFEPISFRLQASQKELKAWLDTPAIAYEQARLTKVHATLHSDYKKLLATIEAVGIYKRSTADIHATLSYQKSLRYTLMAKVHNPKLELPLRYAAYQAIDLNATGDLHSATLQATNPLWKIDGKWIAPQNFELKSDPIEVAKLYDLPKTLQDLTLTLQAKGDPKNIDYRIDSNYALIQGLFQKPLLQARIDFLRPIGEVRLPVLNPTYLDLDFTSLAGRVHNALFDATFDRSLAHVTIGKSDLSIKKSQGWDIRLHTPSIQNLLSHLGRLISLPKISNDGELDLAAHYDKGRYRATLKAPKLTGEPSFLDLKLHGDSHRLLIDYYAIYIKGHGLYATKPSIILLGDKITIKQFWIEDKIVLQGHFWPKSKKGELTAVAKKYHYSSIEGEATLDANLRATLALPKIEVDGSVWLEDGTITYAPKKIRSISDPDIVVVDQVTPKEDYFTKYVALSIHIGSKKPILYKIPHLLVWLKPDLSLYKEYQKPLELLGLLRIVRGRYQIADQYFLILPSTLSFYGPPTAPLLDLHLKTRKDRYIIFITISGDAQHPILSFDSEPYLKPNEILSLLAFGSSGKLLGSTLGTGRFTSLVSNLFLKDLVRQLGLKLDTLTLTTNGGRVGFEIGTHLSDKISVIYKNDEISTIIIRYELSDHLEAEAIFGPSKSGAHLYYRQIR